MLATVDLMVVGHSLLNSSVDSAASAQRVDSDSNPKDAKCGMNDEKNTLIRRVLGREEELQNSCEQ